MQNDSTTQAPETPVAAETRQPSKKKSSLKGVVEDALKLPTYQERIKHVIDNYPERVPLSLSVATLTKLML